jgi:hypothetical protein
MYHTGLQPTICRCPYSFVYFCVLGGLNRKVMKFPGSACKMKHSKKTFS